RLRLRLGNESADRSGDREILRGDVLGRALDRAQASQRRSIGEIITLTRENNKIAADELNSVGNKIRFKFDDLA
ncbi:hypothetical protein, partial [Bradyrhizobium campsiandrae]|uniref:hypothetical protein n=1 Tax=Bradyrhizobium campsiandrae TaxID=1729892 RepID=UPI001AEE4A80